MTTSRGHAFSLPFSDGYQTATLGGLSYSDLSLGKAVSHIASAASRAPFGLVKEEGVIFAYAAEYLDVPFSDRTGAVISHVVRVDGDPERTAKALRKVYEREPDLLRKLATYCMGNSKASQEQVRSNLEVLAHQVEALVGLPEETSADRGELLSPRQDNDEARGVGERDVIRRTAQVDDNSTRAVPRKPRDQTLRIQPADAGQSGRVQVIVSEGHIVEGLRHLRWLVYVLVIITCILAAEFGLHVRLLFSTPASGQGALPRDGERHWVK